jgi:hypothetical protein
MATAITIIKKSLTLGASSLGISNQFYDYSTGKGQKKCREEKVFRLSAEMQAGQRSF